MFLLQFRCLNLIAATRAEGGLVLERMIKSTIPVLQNESSLIQRASIENSRSQHVYLNIVRELLNINKKRGGDNKFRVFFQHPLRLIWEAPLIMESKVFGSSPIHI